MSGTTTRRITFGLRNMKTGRFLRVEARSNVGQDFCGEETCELSEYEGDPRFECDSLARLVSVMTTDTIWYNSSRTHPGHGTVRIEDCAPWVFVREETHDFEDGDPVAASEHSALLRIPEFVQGAAMNSVQPKPELLRATFGSASELDEEAHAFVTVVRPEGPVEPGMIVSNGMYGYGVVVSEAAVPASWPLDPGRRFDRSDPAFRLVLARSDLLRDPDFALACAERKDDEAPAVSMR